MRKGMYNFDQRCFSLVFSFLLDIFESTPCFPVVLVCIYYIYIFCGIKPRQKKHTHAQIPHTFFICKMRMIKSQVSAKFINTLLKALMNFQVPSILFILNIDIAIKLKKNPRENRKSPQQKRNVSHKVRSHYVVLTSSIFFQPTPESFILDTKLHSRGCYMYPIMIHE